MTTTRTPLCQKLKSKPAPVLPKPVQSNPNDKSCVEIPDDLTEEQLEALLRPSD